MLPVVETTRFAVILAVLPLVQAGCVCPLHMMLPVLPFHVDTTPTYLFLGFPWKTDGISRLKQLCFQGHYKYVLIKHPILSKEDVDYPYISLHFPFKQAFKQG